MTISHSTTTASVTSVASSATSVTLFTAAIGTNARTIFNDSSALLYVKFGATASSSSYTVQVPAGGYYEFPQPIYAGQVDAVWASANGNARLTSW